MNEDKRKRIGRVVSEAENFVIGASLLAGVLGIFYLLCDGIGRLMAPELRAPGRALYGMFALLSGVPIALGIIVMSLLLGAHVLRRSKDEDEKEG